MMTKSQTRELASEVVKQQGLNTKPKAARKPKAVVEQELGSELEGLLTQDDEEAGEPDGGAATPELTPPAP